MKDRINALVSGLLKRNRWSLLRLLAGIVVAATLTIQMPEKPWLDKDLPKLDTTRNLQELLSPHLSPVVQLYRKGKFYCTAFVIGNNYALTASHCLLDDNWEKTDEDIDIRLENKSTGVVAKAAGVYIRRDLGLLKGDFRKFGMIEVENDAPGLAEWLMTCGFPGGNKKLLCTRFVPQMNDGFAIKGAGFVQPGMSGGPVINPESKKAVGINIIAYPAEGSGGGVGIASLTGVLGIFDIEP